MQIEAWDETKLFNHPLIVVYETKVSNNKKVLVSFYNVEQGYTDLWN